MKEEKNKQEGTAPFIPGGLNTDSSLVTQPPGTTRFVFTGVNETKEGDLGFLANEESNQECYDLDITDTVNTIGPGYVPIGKVYIGGEDNLIFLANPNGDSAMAILHKDRGVSIAFSDKRQAKKMGFKVTQQIDASFRLRRGCERVVYWVDPKPRMFILDKEEEFKDPITGDWEISKFNLFKTSSKIPEILDIETIDGGGTLTSGSYNFSIQYLDEDFNPTEFLTSTETISIYNTPSSTNYRDKKGSSGKKESSYFDFPKSNKAIKISFKPSSLDTAFPFYRLAITEATAGGGLITDTKYTSEISTQNPVFYYTGENYESIGSQEEITVFNNIIEKAQSIEQIENRLVLGNVEGKQINFCKLQKFASRINADLITKPIIITSDGKSNSKDPAAHFNGIGYMPGEIYSFGIVYIFDDTTTSPVYHIPGKSPLASIDEMYSLGDNIYPMSNVNNSCESTRYIDNNTCGIDTYWGRDSKDQSLTDEKVRHHRFPLRTDYDIPFIEKIEGKEDGEDGLSFNKLIKVLAYRESATCPKQDVDGFILSSADFGRPSTFSAYTYEIEYDLDGVIETFYPGVVDPVDFVCDEGENLINDVEYPATSPTINGDSLVIVAIREVFEYDDAFPATSPTIVTLLGPVTDPIVGNDYYEGTSTATGMTYRIDVLSGVIFSEEPQYKSYIFGIQFSNIQKPSLEVTGGREVIGYYIVRNERKESDRTIVDSAVLLSTTQQRNFVAQGLLFPEFHTTALEVQRIKKDVLGFISPEHKFNNTRYATFDKIIQQGEFRKEEVIKSHVKINDVADGSGYVSGKHKDGESDDDGFTLQVKTRDVYTKYYPSTSFTLDDTNIKEIYYLNALEDKITKDSADKSVDVFNLACDNKIGILHLKQNFSYYPVRKLPYVYLCRNIIEPYSNYRLEPYYKESTNPETFDEDTNEGVCQIFNGDSYVNSMKYVNSIYYDIRMKKRKGKGGVLSIVFGILLIAAAIVVSIISFGTLAPLAIAGIAIGLGIVAGIGVTLLMSGITQQAWNKAYNILYKQGLRDTISDSFVLYDIDPITGDERGFSINPEDDEIQWLGDCANLWFESSVNMGLRNGLSDNTPAFIDAPGRIESGDTHTEYNHGYFGIWSVRTERILPTTALDFQMLNKLTSLDAKRKDGRSYLGLAMGEVYLLNPDYTRRNKQKIFNHLGLEYDCCSDCVETFPHRFHWSEQAFQEELTDNYRMFLPNNYKDMEGETGEITDIFRRQNNLYIHTAEGLWHCPQTFQERTTNEILSFIGTGEYFSIPPRKMVDDDNSSAGNIHKWARLKTKYGILFPSFKEKKWYLFNGEKLEPISDNGNSNYFKINMNFLLEDQYYNVNQKKYPYSNLPSNLMGVGFLSTYDTNKERLIITKKDNQITNLPTTPYEICAEGEDIIVFPNMIEVIAERLLAGWDYIGIEDCKMKFEKTTYQTKTDVVSKFVAIPNDMDIWAFFDDTMDPVELAQLENAFDQWIINDLETTEWTGTVNKVFNSTEKWLNFPSLIPLVDRKKVLLLSFVNEAVGGIDPYYNNVFKVITVCEEDPLGPPPTYPLICGPVVTSTLLMSFSGQPTSTYVTHYNDFTGVGGVYSTFEKFIGVNYPIVSVPESKNFLMHSLAAIKGRDFTLAEVNEIPFNNYFLATPALVQDWETMKGRLLDNPYSTLLDPDSKPGLEQYGWNIVTDRSNAGSSSFSECPDSELIISPCQFASDMKSILTSAVERVEEEVTNTYPVTEVEYEEGEVFVPEFLKAGYTMSYSLKRNEWVGWHPYIPSFYMHVQEKFYSWLQGSEYIWKHNRPNHYQTFYGVRYPFIVEYVDNNNGLMTKVWDHLMFQTEAKSYDPTTEEYLDQRYITFNKALFYNTQQISGELTLVPKQEGNVDYLSQQTFNTPGSIPIDRNERNWTLNDLRDYRKQDDNTISYTVPMFIKSLPALQSNYYIDKIVNPDAVDYNKDWTQVESFRDKFLVVRLIFDSFANIRLIFNFSIFDKKQSER